MEVEIKRADPGDCHVVADLSNITFIETYRGSCPDEDLLAFMDHCFSESSIREELDDPDDHYYIAYADGFPAGYMRMKENITDPLPAIGKAIEIKRIYVLKDYHRQRIGSALMERAIQLASPAYDLIALGVWEENSEAIGFYKKWGFQDINHPHRFYVGNSAQTDRWMVKRLDDVEK